MIVVDPAVANVSTAEYLHTKETFGVVDGFSSPTTSCCFGMCEVPLPVFADLPNQAISRNNDFTKIGPFSVPAGSTVICTLTNTGTGVDTIIVDGTYGVYANVGDLTARPLVWGFIADWYNIANLLSFGNYQFNINIKNSSGTEIFDNNTPCYELRPYSCEAAQGTIRFDVTQEGYIENGFDYRTMTGLAGFFKLQQLRVYGSLDKNPITITDYITGTDNENIHVQTGITHEYDIRVDYLSGDTYDLFFKNLLLENPIRVSTYNSFDSTEYENLEVSYLDANKEPKAGSKQERETLKFKDYKEGNKKRY